MVYHKFTLNELMKPKYAFASSGVFFILLGLLLFDPYLIRAGNTVLFIGVVMSIKTLEYFQCLLLFFAGFIISFKLVTLGVLIEAVALVLWSTSKISALLTSPTRMIKNIFFR